MMVICNWSPYLYLNPWAFLSYFSTAPAEEEGESGRVHIWQPAKVNLQQLQKNINQASLKCHIEYLKSKCQHFLKKYYLKKVFFFMKSMQWQNISLLYHF